MTTEPLPGTPRANTQTAGRRLNLLVVAPSEQEAQALVEPLRRYGFSPEARTATSMAQVREALGTERWDAVLAHYSTPGVGPVLLLETVKEAGAESPVIVVSDVPGEERAVEVIKAGASDYVMMGNLARLGPCLERELKAQQELLQERKRREECLQSQRLESLGRLAGGVAHDFNNLLTAVMGYTHLAMTSLPPDHKVRRDLQEIQRAAQRAADLTRQLLAFSRQDVVKPRVVDLNRVIEETTGMLRRLIGEDIRMVTVPGPRLWPIKIDPLQIEQVLVNLVVNARDAMPGGGTLIIETNNTEVDDHQAEGLMSPGPYVVLSVSDTGVGIPQDVLEHIFEPFFTTKGPEHGTGLGLATCFGIVRQNGGHITVDTVPGAGTTFRVYLPACNEGGQACPEDQEQGHGVPASVGATVLLVEDDLSLRRLAERVLEEQGYRVLAAGNGVEALHLLREEAVQRLDVVVTDVMMPLMGGKELADKVRELYPEVPVLFTSGYTDSIIVNRGMLRPDSDFMYKPYSPADLVKKVAEILERAS